LDSTTTSVPARIVDITGAGPPFDGRFRVKVGAVAHIFDKEYLINHLLSERTGQGQLPAGHSAFLTAPFGFHFRDTVNGPDRYGLAVPLVDVWTFEEVMGDAELARKVGPESLLRGFAHLLFGRYMAYRYDCTLPGHPTWVHGDHHPGHIVLWKDEVRPGLRRMAYIDFVDSDITYNDRIDDSGCRWRAFCWYVNDKLRNDQALAGKVFTAVEEQRELHQRLATALRTMGEEGHALAVEEMQWYPPIDFHRGLVAHMKRTGWGFDQQEEEAKLVDFVDDRFGNGKFFLTLNEAGFRGQSEDQDGMSDEKWLEILDRLDRAERNVHADEGCDEEVDRFRLGLVFYFLRYNPSWWT